jgi:uncharacterized protein YdeI (YjbR/CyaY-like superfamily)
MKSDKQKHQLEIRRFKSAADYRKWLARNHARSEGIWMQICKKGSGEVSVTYAEALDHSLCHGWIDSQKRSHDEKSFLQRFGPRRPKSGWSKINTLHAERLIKSGGMTPAGLAVINAAKMDGRWKAAYDPPSTATLPEAFLKVLSKNRKAKAFFETLNKANRYAIAWRLQTARKPETVQNRTRTIIAMLACGEKFH